jgi:type IX secretion system PorP/SprF family membrane protein
MLRKYLVIGFLVLATIARGQYFQFTQYNFTAQRVNPAWVGLSRDASLDFIYRHQKTGGDFQLNTNALSVAYPFFQRSTGKPWSGIGVSLLSDKSGPLFKSQEAAVTYAVNISTGRYQNLSLGFKGLMRWQRVNFDGLFTGLQYLDGHGFDPALDNGELPNSFQSNFFTLSSGLLWQQTNRYGKLLKQIGFSFFDFNKPNPNFRDGREDELPSTLVAHLAWVVHQQNQWTIMPEVLLTHSSSKNVITGGGRFQYDLSKTRHVDFITKYAVGRSGIAGIQLHQENFSFGISYDFPLGNRNVGNVGAFELGLEYRSPMDPKSKKASAKKKAKRKKSALAANQNQIPSNKNSTSAKAGDGTQKTPGPNPSTATATPDAGPSITKIPAIEITEVNPVPEKDRGASAAAGNISFDPLLVEKITLHFRFEYNSTDLDEDTEEFLDELIRTMQENEKLSVMITGHTDNVGSAHLNHRLSLKRAEAVKAYLLKQGIDLPRITTEGKGLTEPLNGNSTDEERALNRRVEIKLVSNR